MRRATPAEWSDIVRPSLPLSDEWMLHTPETIAFRMSDRSLHCMQISFSDTLTTCVVLSCLLCAGSSEYQKLKERGTDMYQQVKATEQAAKLVEHGREILGSEKTKELLDTSRRRAESLSDKDIDLDPEFQQVMQSSAVKRVVETGSKLLQNEKGTN